MLGRGKDSFMLDTIRRAGIAILHEDRREWSKMSEVFLSSRLLLLPSKREPWGLVCNEAMQCGVPCIVSPNVGAADDLVTNENGVVVPFNVDQWATAALGFIDEEGLWEQRSRAARQATATRTIEHAANVYEAMTRAAVAA